MTLCKALQPVGFIAGWHYAHMETHTVYHFCTGEVSKDFGSSKKKLLTISTFVKISSCVSVTDHPDGAQGNAKGWPPASPMFRKPKSLTCYQSTTGHADHRKHFENTWLQEKGWFPLNSITFAVPSFFLNRIAFLITQDIMKLSQRSQVLKRQVLGKTDFASRFRN